MQFESTLKFAEFLDNQDPLYSLKNKFYFPSSNPIYLCGHSLGLQPKQTYVNYRSS